MKMKTFNIKTIWFLIISVIITESYAQNTFDLLISTPWHEVITNSVEDNDGNYYFAGWKAELYSSEKCGWLIKINHNGEIINEMTFCATDTTTILSDLKINNDTLIVFGMKGSLSEGKNIIMKMALDLDFNLLLNDNDQILSGYYLSSLNSIYTRKGNLLICGNVTSIENSQDYDIYFYELDNNLDSIRLVVDSREFIQNAVDFIEDTINHCYKVIGFGSYENAYPGYDELIEFDTLFNFVEVDSVPWYLKNQFSVERLNNNNYLISGKKHIIDADRVDLGIIKLNNADELLARNHFGKGGDIINYPAINSISLNMSNEIFFGGTSNISNTFDPFPAEDSWLILNKLDTNLNLILQNFYGGDAFYHMIGLQATGDGGCLIYSERYDENTQIDEYDVYILKVDSSGLLTSTGDYTSIPVQQLSISPNPARDRVRIGYPDIFENDEKELMIYNAFGVLVMKIDATDENSQITIDTIDLPGGLYFIVLNVNGKKTANGKMVKS